MKYLSLKHFIIRSQVLSLYRDTLRTITKIQDQDYRIEMRQWLRHEFAQRRHLKDLGDIRTQVALGRRSLNELKLSMQMAS